MKKNLLIDESMMLQRGCLVIQDYIKNKRHKYRIKFYELCKHDGLFLTNKAKGGQVFNDKHNLCQTAAILLKLLNTFFNKCYYVFSDNYYNSVALTELLLEKRTYVTGTLIKD